MCTVQTLTVSLRDAQECPAVACCRRCGGEVYPGEHLYPWQGRKLCPDCFRTVMVGWLNEAPDEVARAVGVEPCLPEGGADGEAQGTGGGIYPER